MYPLFKFYVNEVGVAQIKAHVLFDLKYMRYNKQINENQYAIFDKFRANAHFCSNLAPSTLCIYKIPNKYTA